MIEKQYIEEGERLRKVRKKIGITAEEIADKMGIVPNSYRQIEQGRSGFSMNLIKTMAIHYQVSINWLLLGQGSMFIDMNKTEEENGGEKHLLHKKQVSHTTQEYTHEQLVSMIMELKQTVDSFSKKQVI